MEPRLWRRSFGSSGLKNNLHINFIFKGEFQCLNTESGIFPVLTILCQKTPLKGAEIKVYSWPGDICFELAEDITEKEFPMNEQSLYDINDYLSAEYKKVKDNMTEAGVNG